MLWVSRVVFWSNPTSGIHHAYVAAVSNLRLAIDQQRQESGLSAVFNSNNNNNDDAAAIEGVRGL